MAPAAAPDVQRAAAMDEEKNEMPTSGSQQQVLDRIRDHGIVAVVRAGSAQDAQRCAAALVAGGVLGIEITYTTPDAASAITALHLEFGAGIALGAGTLTTVEQVQEAAAAGAGFLVSPGTRPALATAMTGTGLATLLGVLTPSEVMLAQDCGADAIKIFPAMLGGAGYLAALRGPFPDLRAIPTGGVDPDNLASWFRAGAWAVGVGGELCPRALIDGGDWAEITRRAQLHVAALTRARNR